MGITNLLQAPTSYMGRQNLGEQCGQKDLTEEAHCQTCRHRVEAVLCEIVEQHRVYDHWCSQMKESVNVEIALKSLRFASN